MGWSAGMGTWRAQDVRACSTHTQCTAVSLGLSAECTPLCEPKTCAPWILTDVLKVPDTLPFHLRVYVPFSLSVTSEMTSYRGEVRDEGGER